jgi:hypothetical protein
MCYGLKTQEFVNVLNMFEAADAKTVALCLNGLNGAISDPD